MLRRIDVTAFVDWRSQIANAGQGAETRAKRRAERTLDYVIDAVADALFQTKKADLFKARVRLYHGWHTGLTATCNRTALDDLLQTAETRHMSRNVRFDWSEPFGDVLLDALLHRRHPRLRCHLPDTCRQDLQHIGLPREKMVDTAMVCDILYTARTAPGDWRLIMAEDDDMVPAAFVAEKWGKDKGGKTFLLRSRREFGHLALKGLLFPLERIG